MADRNRVGADGKAPKKEKDARKDANKLIFIKVAHTLIWVFFVAAIFYVLYSGIAGEITTMTWISIGLVLFEGLILLIFKMRCPLTYIAREYSDSQKDNFDIYLPNWLAKYNKQIFTAIFAIGLVLVIYRVFLDK